MYRMKRIVATLLLLVVIGLGTPQVFADGSDGPSETPTSGVKIQTEIPDPTQATQGVVAGIVYFLSTLIP